MPEQQNNVNRVRNNVVEKQHCSFMYTKQAEAFNPRLLVIHEVDVFLAEVSSVKDETGFLSNQSSDDLIQMIFFHILRSHSNKYSCLSSSITSNGKHSVKPP